ncbi:glycosyltransferase [Rhizorhabdus argentea]|uniref:glycosyltransferase n=1 Tax=Rhizorhabdus argentea TaxID=1387174 RepID=UPI0030EE9B84
MGQISETSARAKKVVLTLHMFGQGGTDRVCAHLAGGFMRAGFDTEILNFCAGGQGESALHGLLEKGVRVTTLGRTSGSRPRDLLSGLPRYVRHLRRERPDYVVSTGNNMNWITAMGLSLSRVPSRLALKTTNPIVRSRDGAATRFWRMAGYRRAFAAAHAIWTLSDAETAQLRAAFPASADRFRTVTNPYVTPEMLIPPGRAAGQDGRRYVIAVGRLAPQKRMDLLIRAFARVTTPDSHLLLLGEGSGRAKLEQIVRDLGIGARVSMPGFVPNISEWLHRAELLVLPSVYEGLPAVVLEAMAANCPVLATDCFPAARDMVGGAEGCAIIERADIDLLARMIDQSLAEPKPKHLAPVASRYSIENGIRSHVDALSALG